MQIVGTRLGDDVDRGARAASVFRRGGVGHNAELLHRGKGKVGEQRLSPPAIVAGTVVDGIGGLPASAAVDDEKGVAEITKLDIDEYGRVSGGLPGFFEQNIRNVIEYLEALNTNK